MSEATRAENVAPKPYDLEAHYQELEQKITAAGIPADLGRVRAAFECADRAHSGQKRRDGSPYVSHCIAAAIITAEMGLDEDSIIAALLHDTIEDTSLTHEDIARSFGASVADIVEGVTKLTRMQYTSVEEQQMENMRKMLLAMAKDIRVILIKMADRLHNMRTMAYQSEEKQRIKSLETMEIYAPIAHRLGMQKIKWELEDLSLLYLDPAGYKAITDALDERMPTLEKFMGEMRTQIRERLEADGVHATISSRIKHIYSIYRKMYAQKLDINGIFDLCAFRVIVDTIPDCYNVLGIIHDMYKPLPGRFKDYISTPKPNMYQSVHTTVIGSEGIPFEVQIRTWEMHMTAEYGVAAHWKYKTGSGEGTKPGDEEKFAWIRRLLETQQESDAQDFFHNLKVDMFADEVFVFSPKGDVINLPAGATPIDFAYSIHSAIGNSMVGATVNGRIVNFDYVLQNGDIVDIRTSKNAPGPSRDWLNLAKSGAARTKIKQWFKKERREENIAKGREMLEKETKRLGYDIKVLLKADKLKTVAASFRLDSEEALYASVGYGGVTLNGVMSKLVELYKKEQKLTVTKDLSQLLAELKPRRSKAKASHGILVKGEEGIMVKLARCCNPIPGDPVIGYITRGSGISVHRTDCPNVLSNNPDEQRRLIEVSWDITTDAVYKVNIVINASDRPGMMADIMQVTSEAKLNINALNCRTDKHKNAYITMGLDISNLEQLDNIMNKIKRMKGVYSVERQVSSSVHHL